MAHQRHKKEVEQAEHDAESCEICLKAERHLKKASAARDKYRKDSELDNFYSVDMQKVIILPKLTRKESFF